MSDIFWMYSPEYHGNSAVAGALRESVTNDFANVQASVYWRASGLGFGATTPHNTQHPMTPRQPNPVTKRCAPPGRWSRGPAGLRSSKAKTDGRSIAPAAVSPA